MTVENPNNLLLFSEHKKALESGERLGNLLVSPVTQPESQMVGSITKVLQAIDRHQMLNTKSIQEITGLYSNSINRVIRLLKKKKIVNVATKEDRKNNEKIYSLKRNRAIVYLNHLISHKNKRHLIFKKIAESGKSDRVVLKFLQEEFVQKKIIVPLELQKKYNLNYDEPVAIENLPYHLAKEIMIRYMHGYYCFHCFDKCTISKLELVNEFYYCRICHAETATDDQISKIESIKSKTKRKQSKNLVDRQISLVREGMDHIDAVKKSQDEMRSRARF